MKDRSYCITLYAWTSWGADPNLGYNLIKLEDGELFVPRDEDSTYFEMRSRVRPEGNDFKSKLCAKWRAKSEANAYNIVGENGDGSRVILGTAGSSSTALEIDGDQAVSLGVSEDTYYLLEGVILEEPIVIGGPIEDRILPIRCTPLPLPGWAVPEIKSTIVLDGASSNIAYISWNTFARRAPLYKIYRVQGVISDPEAEGLNYIPIGSTTNDYFVFEEEVPPQGENICYKVAPFDSDDETQLADPSIGELAYYVDKAYNPSARNLSVGNGTRIVEVTLPSFDYPVFADGSGLSYRLYRVYQSSADCNLPSFAESSKYDNWCPDQAQYEAYGTVQEPVFTDTGFNSVDGQPLVFYKWEVFYNDEMLIGSSECASTFVGSCVGNTETIDVSAAWPGTTDLLGNPLVNINWSVPPSVASTPGDFIFSMYVDGYKTYDEPAYQSHSVQMPIGSNTGDQHTVQIVATNLCSGCEIVSNELILTIPSYEIDCPTTQDTMHVITNILGPNDGDTISVQLLWTGATGAMVDIYRSDTGEAGSYVLLAEVDSTENSYEDNTVLSGHTVYYYLKSVTYNSETQACVKANSEIEQIVASPMAGQQMGTVYFYVRDHLGSSRLVLDSTGNILSKFNYEPYGVELTPLGSNTTNEKYKYTGQERDYDTGMDYIHARFYASSMGRFLKPDNLIGNMANPQSWNLYSYVNGNPVNFNDPTGHDLRGKQGKMGMSFALAGVPNVDISGMLTPVEMYEFFGANIHPDEYMTAGQYYRIYGQSTPGHALTAQEQDYAMLANAVYNPWNSPLPAGWEVCEAQSWDSGLLAAVFYNSQSGEHVVGFAGVNEFQDVTQSLGQMVTGSSAQFEQAYQYVKDMRNKYGGSPTLVGHSLGGGLAAAVGVQLGLQARTFNAEGVNARTVGGQAVLARARDLVINYFTGGDWLTTLQQLTPLPNAAGQQVYVGAGGHGIRWFLIGP